MKPRILISLPEKNEANYINAVSACGMDYSGIYFNPEYDSEPDTNGFDGLILCGGGDVAPHFYGKVSDRCRGINERRDKYEIMLAKRFFDLKKPILGICRGLQVLNIAFGGTLTDDIDDNFKQSHTPLGNGDFLHECIAEADGIFEKLYSCQFTVNSHHHQAIDVLADAFSSELVSSDGIIEGIAHKTHPIIAVQWHPERLALKHKNPSAVDGLKVFEYFCDLCKN